MIREPRLLLVPALAALLVACSGADGGGAKQPAQPARPASEGPPPEYEPPRTLDLGAPSATSAPTSTPAAPPPAAPAQPPK